MPLNSYAAGRPWHSYIAKLKEGDLTGEDVGCGVGCAMTLLAIGIVVAFYIRSRAEEARKRREAEAQYRALLSEAEGNYRGGE